MFAMKITATISTTKNKKAAQGYAPRTAPSKQYGNSVQLISLHRYRRLAYCFGYLYLHRRYSVL